MIPPFTLTVSERAHEIPLPGSSTSGGVFTEGGCAQDGILLCNPSPGLSFNCFTSAHEAGISSEVKKVHVNTPRSQNSDTVEGTPKPDPELSD